MRLPDGSGLDLLKRLEAAKRREKAIVITAYGSAEGAVEALKAGAFDYLTKPVDLRQFRSVVASALGRAAPAAPPSARDAASAAASVRVNEDPSADPGRIHPALTRLAGRSQAMLQVRSLVERVARSMAPVLVQGESGTGKELVARAIHACSTRADAPFIAVNCGAIPEQLLEAEFFGYRKGSFTGAHEDRDGFVQAAQGGTLFLDEIGDLPLAMQSKLLRVIQERTVRPVGAVDRNADQRARGQCHAQGSGIRSARGPLPARPVLPPQRDPDPRAGVARADRRPGRDLRSGAGAHRQRGRDLAGAQAVGASEWSACRSTPFQAMCANSKTCCTARWRCRRAR